VLQAPETAEITLGIRLREKSLSDLVDNTDKVSADIIASLRDNDIDARDIQTSYFSIYPYYTTTGTEYGSTNIDFYVSTKTVTFTLRNISNYDTVMNGLYTAGANRVDQVRFTVEEIFNQRLQARKYAVGNATETARLFAEELNVELTGVYSILDQSYDDGDTPLPYNAAYFYEGAFDSASGSRSGPSISGGEIKISAMVQVSFYIR